MFKDIGPKYIGIFSYSNTKVFGVDFVSLSFVFRGSVKNMIVPDNDQRAGTNGLLAAGKFPPLRSPSVASPAAI